MLEADRRAARAVERDQQSNQRDHRTGFEEEKEKTIHGHEQFVFSETMRGCIVICRRGLRGGANNVYKRDKVKTYP